MNPLLDKLLGVIIPVTVPLIEEMRRQFHGCLCNDVLGYRVVKLKNQRIEVPTNADKDSTTSREIAEKLAQLIAYSANVDLKIINVKGQELGKRFTNHTKWFLEIAFRALEHARPGPWEFSTSQAEAGIAQYEPYTHLFRLKDLLDQLSSEAPDISSAFTQDYLITPDIIIAREPWPDEEINRGQVLINGDQYARYTPFRKRHGNQPLILHASVSCKWTLRSDRAQNARTEALNLIRNRKGRVPHIVVVLGEPMPTRIASIALGTGDIDCVYHIALPELRRAIQEVGNEDQADMLEQLIEGSRLRDISDLPLDLAV